MARVLGRRPAGTTEVRLPEQGNIEEPTFSPDGRRIAFRFLDVGESQDIWIWNQDQQTLERLTVDGSANQLPLWTPDGTRVAFASTREGRPAQLYWQPADGSGPAERLLETDFAAFPGSWSPDGRTLAFVGFRNGGPDIGLLALGDSTPRWIVETEFAEYQPQISPDGRWLAYTSSRSGALEVYVQATSGEGSRFQVSTDGGHSPRWSPDGGTLYFAGGIAAAAPIMAANVSTTGGFRVTSRVVRIDLVSDLNPTSTSGGSVNYDVSPDGEDLVYVGVLGGCGRSLVWILNWPEMLREMGGGP